ncbi:ATP-binding protein [Herbiconiux sp. CPCC 205716]|uniref:ATP-binding protein n=1 Tax=Herbiconiux gentiana TaxID=2970912 RepID=A0ABT2GC09_9MICO|nr:ATP-binding protein [Herbiconiux gentiana]MCS5713192.1 ATP-binding protein [Herbiconiux gentiana]
MPEVHVSAGQPLLESYTKTPGVGVCELVWNAFDEDARNVHINVERSELGAVEQIFIKDDGRGMTAERANLAFSRVGDSWKRMPGTQTEDGRAVHGKLGRGRYAAFSLGSSVEWKSTSESVESTLASISISGSRGALDKFDIEQLDASAEETGTTVRIVGVPLAAAREFDEANALREQILFEFALQLERHPDFHIYFLGEEIKPSEVIDKRTEVLLPVPDEIAGEANLTIIDWKLTNVERRLYLCSEDGAIIDEMPPRVQAVGAEFTAYVSWHGFRADSGIMVDLDDESPASKVIEAAKNALREHLSDAGRKREAETIERWRSEGVYPYKSAPANEQERATQDTFKFVAMAAARTVDESKALKSKALALSLLKETFETDPEALLPILRKFSQLPQSRIDELKEVLEHTTLSQLISLGHEVGSRVDFLSGLNALLFDKQIKRRMLERRQLHRILAHETWLFGEGWAITGDDERLTEVLKKYLDKLGLDVELANGPPLLREDGSDAIPDLVLGRQLETRENFFSHLVIELKRPNHRLTDDDVTQIRSYASAITNDERFDQPNSHWDFWLIGNEMKDTVEEARNQANLPPGVVQNSKKYTITVRTWAEIIGDAEHRLKFVQESLKYESDRDQGLVSMRDKYSEYLPQAALDSENGTSPEEESEVA